MQSLEAQGYRIVRFWNHDVLGNVEGVLQTILGGLRTDPHPNQLQNVRGTFGLMLPQAGEGA